METTSQHTATSRFSDPKAKWEFPHRALTEKILGAAIQVHRRLGPGFLERMYENALCLELGTRALVFQRQVPVIVRYEGAEIGAHRLDLIVERTIVVEIKAVKDLDDTHLATVLSYLRATRLEAGLLLNFSASRLRIRRVISTGRTTTEAPRSGDAEV